MHAYSGRSICESFLPRAGLREPQTWTSSGYSPELNSTGGRYWSSDVGQGVSRALDIRSDLDAVPLVEQMKEGHLRVPLFLSLRRRRVACGLAYTMLYHLSASRQGT
jgi:hypothetical protein